MKLFYIIVLILLPFSVCGQIITTFAGCGTGCSGLGDGGPATAAQLGDPIGGIFDGHGNYFFAEGVDQRVRKINTSGIIETIAGNGSSGFSGDGGQASAALLRGPDMVKIDSLENIYICDNGNFRVRRINYATGLINTIVGNGTAGFYGDGGQATDAEIYGCADMCFDKFGNLYISDYANHRIRKVNRTGIISTFAGNGILGFSGDGGPATSANFGPGISGLTADDSGNIYIADFGNGRVRKVNTSGIISTFAGNGTLTYGGDGIAATAASIDPSWISFTNNGNLLIADKINYRVYEIDNSGILHNIAGNGTRGYAGDGGPGTAAELDFPSGVTVDACGNIYIPEADNDRIRKITYSGTGVPIVVTVAAPAAAKIDSTVTLIANITGGCCGVADTIIWYNKGVVFATTTTNTVTYTKTMNTDSITAKAKGCGDSSVSGVYVITKNTTSTPGPFSTSGEGVTCYPNPVHSELVIHAGFEIENVVITNIVGQVVLQLSAVASQLSVCDVRGLVKGVYFVKVYPAFSAGENGVYVEKFVKE